MELEFKGVHHWFGAGTDNELLVLDGIDLAVEDKEFVSVIGPSGCGKSTMLHIAAGLIKPSKGLVLHEGVSITGPDRNRGMIFQSDAVFPWLTVQGNVEYGLKRQGITKEKRKKIAHEYISLVGLTGWESRYPKELSGGMRKRVDVARVFANNPSVFLLDESFGQLDTQTKERLQIELLRLWEREQKTVLFVTHDIEEAIFLADRVIVMSPRPGKFIAEITIPFNRPRRLNLKTTPSFQDIRRELVNMIVSDINDALTEKTIKKEGSQVSN
jgi:NitT/TauT family transport system ATP-binding protein